MSFARLTAIFFAILLLPHAATYAAGMHSGGHGHGKEHDGHAHGFGKAGKATEIGRTIDIVMKDSFYEPKSIAIKAGETVRFQVVNKGELLHEFNIGTAAMHASHQKEMMTMAERGVLEADKINHHMMKMGGAMAHDDPNSVLLEPGGSGEIVWTFSKAANLEFACNVPGHYDAGMMGHIHFK
jgi:uncharacterized cupredoxin-like copper-binding protein